MAILFTQFLRPDGRQKPVEIDRPAEVEELARVLIAAGCEFHVEELRTLEISMSCEYGEETLAQRVCRNGPPVLDNVDALVKEAHERFTAAGDEHNPVRDGWIGKDGLP